VGLERVGSRRLLLPAAVADDRCASLGDLRIDGLLRHVGSEQLAEMQRIIEAEKSDLFDVLAYVAYALPPLAREQRAEAAKVVISTHFTTPQQTFLDFVLGHYVQVGVAELDESKLTPLLRLKYHNSIADAVADLGSAAEIRKAFTGFQKYLYQQRVAA
jgi:type I restriction enzyme, R subunit